MQALNPSHLPPTTSSVIILWVLAVTVILNFLSSGHNSELSFKCRKTSRVNTPGQRCIRSTRGSHSRRPHITAVSDDDTPPSGILLTRETEATEVNETLDDDLNKAVPLGTGENPLCRRSVVIPMRSRRAAPNLAFHHNFAILPQRVGTRVGQC